MMTLATMKRFFDTVRADGTSPIADQIAARWSLTGAEVRVVRASANFVFRIRSVDGDGFLRFNHASERNDKFIEAECRFLAHLAAAGILVNLPRRSAGGRLVESVETEMGVFYAVMLSTVPGKHHDFDYLDVRGFESWGRLVGEIHSASKGSTIAGRPSWTDLVADARTFLPDAELAARVSLDHVERAMSHCPHTSDSFGLIHCDLELDNILWEERPGVVDFDSCAYYPFAMDIASALRDLWKDCGSKVDDSDARLLAFIRGYRGAHALPPEELARLPLYLRLHDLLEFARLIRTLKEPTPNAPEWVGKLRARLEAVLQRKRLAFAADPQAIA